MEPRIETITEKKLVGTHVRMSLVENKTLQLWQGFMPLRQEITNNVNNDLISMQVYDHELYFADFNPESDFTKWAAAEVSDHNAIPGGMEAFTLPGGLYAVFPYKGTPADGARMFRYIFAEWLPDADYVLDHRPHFEILSEKYRNEDPDSEEEIWIPVKPKSELS